MHKRLVALPGRQAAEHRRGGGRETHTSPRYEGVEWGVGVIMAPAEFMHNAASICLFARPNVDAVFCVSCNVQQIPL